MMNCPDRGGTDHAFVLVDVFSEAAFGGNPLAVFPDAAGLSDDTMQRIAREFNFAETSFVLRSGSVHEPDRIRIFTPRRELPFAGHPTVGTAAVMAFLGLARMDGDGRVVYHEAIGPVSVRVSSIRQRLVVAELTLETPLESPIERPALHHVASALSLADDDVIAAWFAAVGVRFCYVHLRDRATVDRAVLDRQSWNVDLASSWAPQLFFFAGDFVPGGTLYARMFAPAFGIEEDPATGSACLALAGVLAQRAHGAGRSVELDIHQGVLMGRPSLMKARADTRGGEVIRMQVGGPSVVVGRGSLHVP